MRHSQFYILILVSLFSRHVAAQLVINEVSQGASGSQEYVEFLITGSGTCNTCVDIRGWIIDDNNGWQSGGIISGTGVADGALRFANITQWSCLNPGTLILIYNSADKNPSITAADDPTDSNKDCIYIFPTTNATLLEKNTTNPNSVTYTSDYSTITFSSGGGSWTLNSMSNSDDSYHIVSPTTTTSPYFSVGWGNNTTLQNVYFAGAVTGEVIYMANTSNNDPFNSANWVNTVVAGNETPGVANNAANGTWISSLKGTCSTPLGITTSGIVVACSCPCGGTANVFPSGGTTAYTVNWSNGYTDQFQNKLCTGTYTVTVTDANSCTVTGSVVVP